jgi:hypothetical protein
MEVWHVQDYDGGKSVYQLSPIQRTRVDIVKHCMWGGREDNESQRSLLAPTWISLVLCFNGCGLLGSDSDMVIRVPSAPAPTKRRDVQGRQQYSRTRSRWTDGVEPAPFAQRRRVIRRNLVTIQLVSVASWS